MAAITAALAIGSAGLGAFNMFQGQQKQQDALNQQGNVARQQAEVAAKQTDIAQQQYALSADYSGKDSALNILGAQQSATGAQKSQEINKSILGFQQQIQDQNQQAMELDARRKTLEVVRNQQRARAIGLTTATAQGARQGSGLQGAYGQASGQAGVNILGIQQNLGIGENIAGLNKQTTGKNIEQADLVTQMAQQQADLTTQKSQLMNNYAQSNATLQSAYAAFGGQLATLQGQQSYLSAQAQSGASQASMGNAFLSAAPGIMNFGMNAGNILGIGGSSPGPLSLAPPNPMTLQAGSYLPMNWAGLRGTY